MKTSNQLSNLDLQRNTLQNNIKESRLEIKKLDKEKGLLKEKSNKEFRKKHRKTLLFFDSLIVLIIILNLGALLITNALVMKEEPKKELREVNPVAAELNKFTVHPEANRLMFQVQFFTIIWAMLIMCYLYGRNNINSKLGLNMLGGFVVLYLLGLGTDFINNLGYFIGVKLFGG